MNLKFLNFDCVFCFGSLNIGLSVFNNMFCMLKYTWLKMMTFVLLSVSEVYEDGLVIPTEMYASLVSNLKNM
jgi:hypothetical protein